MGAVKEDTQRVGVTGRCQVEKEADDGRESRLSRIGLVFRQL